MARGPAGPTPPPPQRRAQLLLVALAFFGPVLLAIGLYYGSGWRPPGRSNHGVLIDPPRALSSSLFHGKWSLVYVGSGACDADCRQTLHYMHQTHLGLGRLYDRVQPVFLVTGQCCDRAFLAHEYPRLTTVDTADPGAAAGPALLAVFPPERRATSIFIVDPRGNLMMRYDSRAAPEGLLDDLKKLLNLSSIG
ncbi:MAG TPA: hypothetical protein VHX52_08480 [Steroidobacteraceae bacterium]|jgi:hypothetical protein|nr:hypothetical protein [Steroidobacteraceae bacterium]